MLLNSLSLIVGTLYIIVGVFVIVTKTFAIKLDPITANFLGVLLCLYGLFRIARVIIRLRKNNSNGQ